MWNKVRVAGSFLVGQVALLSLDQIDGEEVRGMFLDISPTEVIVSFPDRDRPPPGYLPGRTVVVKFSSHQGVHHAKTTIVRVSTGTTVNVVIQRFWKFQTVQKRNFFRVIASLSVTFSVVKTSVFESHGATDQQAFTKDISAGGLSFDTPLALAVGDRVKVSVSPPRSLSKTIPTALTAEAQVVRVIENNHGPKLLYGIGLEYRFVTEAERDRWVQLTFHLQRGSRD